MQFSFKNQKTSLLFIQSTALFLLIAKILSWKLWIADRVFPLAPPFDFLYNVPNFVHYIFLIISLACLCICIIKPTYYKALLILLISELLSCFLEQNRWQPWVYQYVFMFFVLWYNRKNENLTIVLLIIICSSTYFYSGLQKLTPHFFKITWKRTILEGFMHLPKTITDQALVIRLGYLAPIMEISLGLGLLFKRTRKITMLLLIIMHTIIMIIIGPWGINYNIIVWPWNVAMVVYFIIIWNKEIDFSVLKKQLTPNINWITLLAWIIMPLFNFIGYWDFFFSSSLYAGRIDMCNIEITNPPIDFELKKYYRPKKIGEPLNKETIVVQTWAMGEFTTPSCPQKRVYKKIKKKWLKKYPTINTKFLFIDRSKRKTKVSELE